MFTNGVFDILHRGHVTYLAEARALGPSMAVALNSDASVGGWARATTADQPLEDRLAVLAALESVALVTWSRRTRRSGASSSAGPTGW